MSHESTLDLSNRGLQELPEWPEDQQCTALDVSRNQLTSLRLLQPCHHHLTQLNASRNALVALPGLALLPQLRVVNLARNRLAALPCLTGLTSLTELNLRHNLIHSLRASEAAAGGGFATPLLAASAAAEEAGATRAVSCCCLPSSLRRLSLACNRLQDVSSLTALRSLTALLDLCVDDNPFTSSARRPTHIAAAAAQAAAAGGNSGSSGWYREAVLAAVCTPALLMLDGHTVSPAERAVLLTAAARVVAVAGGRQQQAQPDSMPAALTAHACSSSSSSSHTRRAPGEQHEQQGGSVCEQALHSLSLTDPSTGSSSSSSLSVDEGDCLAGETSGRGLKQQQQQHMQQPRDALQHQGSLMQAAVACGLSAEGASSSCQQPAAAAAAGKAVAGAAAAAAAAAVAAADEGVFCKSDADVEEFLQVERARLLSRRPRGPPAPAAGPPATPGMELSGGRCVLTGCSVLAQLLLNKRQQEALSAVSDLTLAHMTYAEVLGALPLLSEGLRQLRCLSLVNTAGLSTLPQLHPLLQLSKLQHLSLTDCPISSLVLLRPYVAFRFTSLQSLNAVPLTAAEVAAAGSMFAGLEAALDAALDQAPQQAAVVAATGICPTSGSSGGGGPHAASSSSARVTQLLAAMHGRPLLPPAAAMQQGAQFAGQLVAEAAAVQQQLWELEEVAWPAMIQGHIHEAIARN